MRRAGVVDDGERRFDNVEGCEAETVLDVKILVLIWSLRQ